MALLNEHLIKTPLAGANEAASRNYAFTDMSLRNAEVVQAMGMMPGLLQRWSRDRNLVLERQSFASDRAATTSSIIRFLRLAMQSMILGLGAYLVIERVTTVGAMFAASILLGRALQPVEQVVGSWRNLISARGAYDRVRNLLAANPARDPALALPRPAGRLSVEGLSYVIPGSNRPSCGMSVFASNRPMCWDYWSVRGGQIHAGAPNCRIILPSAGVVRLDGADVSLWPRESLGRHIGYLPQDIELFADTVASNISRFRNDDDQEVIEAAQMAGVHDMILRLPGGYETQIGEGGAALSGGYRQRIGLARAVYDNPSLVVLDEPSSNLDSDGDTALLSCIAELKKRGTTVVMISIVPTRWVPSTSFCCCVTVPLKCSGRETRL